MVKLPIGDVRFAKFLLHFVEAVAPRTMATVFWRVERTCQELNLVAMYSDPLPTVFNMSKNLSSRASYQSQSQLYIFIF